MSTPATSHHKYLNNPDSFCYICSSFTMPSQRANICAFVKEAYVAYVAYVAPHKVCKQSVESSGMQTKGTREKLAFGFPMVW